MKHTWVHTKIDLQGIVAHEGGFGIQGVAQEGYCSTCGVELKDGLLTKCPGKKEDERSQDADD
ncbi:MAG: hypothetical protein ACYTFG_20175 [Planctomycetota bacterium]|jgi:ferredoxin